MSQGLPPTTIISPSKRSSPESTASETDHCVYDYEFDCDSIPGDITIFPEGHMKFTNPRQEIEPGYSLFERLVKFTPRSENCCSTAENKLTLVLLSSLADAAIYAENNPTELASAIANVVLQGGYEVSPKLSPDPTAANNRFDIKSAEAFHEYMANFKIPSTVFTKHAAVAVLFLCQSLDPLPRTHSVLISSKQKKPRISHFISAPVISTLLNASPQLSTKTGF
jgi:hypothetical protein